MIEELEEIYKKIMKPLAKKWFFSGWKCGKALVHEDLDGFFEELWEKCNQDEK